MTVMVRAFPAHLLHLTALTAHNVHLMPTMVDSHRRLEKGTCPVKCPSSHRATRLGFVLAVSIVFASLLAIVPAQAQEGTPVPAATVSIPASPVAGSVPCTALFGIAEGQACALMLHGAPDAGPIDIYVDGTLTISAAEFGVLGEFIPVASGERQIEFVPSGLGPDAAIATARASLSPGVAYEVFVSGAADSAAVQIIPIDTRPLPANTSRVRVVHGGIDTPAVDLAIVGGMPLVTGVVPGQSSPEIEAPSGIYEMELRAAGTTNVLLPLSGIELLPDTVYSFYVSGSPADNTLGVTLVPVYVTPDIAAAATPVA